MAVQADELDLQSLPPITAVCWPVFQRNPHVMYDLVQPPAQPGRNFYSDVVLDMTGPSRELKVETVEDLHRLTRDLLRMPLLFRSIIKHQKTEHYVVMKVRKVWKDEFALLVNTQHPTIREVFSRRLSEAMQLMQEGKKFCIKIRIVSHNKKTKHPFSMQDTHASAMHKSHSLSGSNDVYIKEWVI